MEQSTRSVRLASWKEIVKRCSNRPEGMTQKQWLADNSIHEKNYYYWQRQVRNEAYAEMTHCPIPAGKPQTGITFAEIPVHQPIPEQQMHDFKADAVIRTSNATIEIDELKIKTFVDNVWFVVDDKEPQDYIREIVKEHSVTTWDSLKTELIPTMKTLDK